MMPDTEKIARAIMAIVMLAFTILGIVLIKNAVDLPMTVFGYLLFIFSVSYVIGLVRQHYNAVDRAQVRTLGPKAVGGKA